MSVKEQLGKLKENWLMIVLGLVVLFFLSAGNGFVGQSFDGIASMGGNFEKGYGEAMSDSIGYSPRSNGGNFAPEVEDRKITRSSSLSTEIERGEFGEAEDKLKNIISSSGAYLLNERVNRNGEGWKGYFSGYYSIKIETSKYDAVVGKLKEIGEVQNFNENAIDVTGQYEDLRLELEVERTRLLRYMEMFDGTGETEYKIDLNDRIFDQERRIKYLENSIRNVDNKLEYSSVSFSMNEERGEWVGVAVVKVSDLVKTLVGSLNALLGLLVGVLPWAFAGWVGWFIWRRVRPQTA